MNWVEYGRVLIELKGVFPIRSHLQTACTKGL